MSDLDDASETDTSYTEELLFYSHWEVREEWLESIFTKYHGEQVSPIRVTRTIVNRKVVPIFQMSFKMHPIM